MEQNNTYNTGRALKDLFTKMEVGDVVYLPIERVSSVRSTVSLLGLALSRLYRTETNREERTVLVKRIS